MVELKQAKESLSTAVTAIAAVASAGNHDRKILGEKVMNGHYIKALQELEKVKKHAEDLVHRAEAQGA